MRSFKILIAQVGKQQNLFMWGIWKVVFYKSETTSSFITLGLYFYFSYVEICSTHWAQHIFQLGIFLLFFCEMPTTTQCISKTTTLFSLDMSIGHLRFNDFTLIFRAISLCRTESVAVVSLFGKTKSNELYLAKIFWVGLAKCV